MESVTSPQSIPSSSYYEYSDSSNATGLPTCSCPIHMYFSPSNMPLVSRVVLEYDVLPPNEINECFTQELRRYYKNKVTLNPDETPNSTLLLTSLRSDYQTCPIMGKAKTQSPYSKAGNSGKQFTCDICGKFFTRKNHLDIHQRKHTGEKPFICNICAKPFASKSNLTQHIKIHTGVRDHQCSKCCKAFTLKGNLTRHQRSCSNVSQH